MADRLAEHRARASSLGLAALLASANHRTEPPQDLSSEDALSLLVAALGGQDRHPYGAHRLAKRLVTRRLPYTLADVHLLVGLTESSRHDVYLGRLCARAALAALELRASAGDDVAEPTRRLLDVVAGPHSYEAAEWTKLAPRLRRLAPSSRSLDLSPLDSDDPWSTQVRPLVQDQFAEQGALLELLASATQSRPSRRWLTSVQPLLDAHGGALVRLLLESAADTPPRVLRTVVIEGREYSSLLWLSDLSATVVRGSAWAASLVDQDWVVPAVERLVALARRVEELKVANACFYCLGERADDEAVALLGRFVAQVKDRRFLKPAQAALEHAAGKRGVTSEELREQLVPTFRLDADGRGAREVGPASVSLEVTPPARVTVRYRLGTSDTASPPAALAAEHGPALAALKAEVAQLRNELGLQRFRLEELLAAERVWAYGDWRRHYLEHPVVQVHARRLIWSFDGRAAIPLERGRFLTLEGWIDPPVGGEVRLWHPLDAGTEEIAAWRDLLRVRELRQPFKQAHRELYLLAPAERETRVYSNRFAAHIVRYAQVYALAKQRGWGIRALGPYDNGGGEQWRDFGGAGVRASFWMELADGDVRGPIAELASTDQVRFTRAGERDALPLDQIPPRVFSEAMRDVDLFVGVASIAGDPTWIDGGVGRFQAYWRRHAFGELSESGRLRRDVLADLIPGLKIADRLELDDRFLRVRGQRHTYRIHLGSANILVEPDDRYLCIVPDRRPAPSRLFLPFDERLSVIVSKALLLAADDKITDETILRQLP